MARPSKARATAQAFAYDAAASTGRAGVRKTLLALSPSQMMADGVTLAGLAALAGGVALVVLMLRALKIGARMRAYQATPAADLTIPSAQPPSP